MKLFSFILDNVEPILQEWETFAKTIFKTVQTQKTLRDHAKKMLLVIASDLQKKQSKKDQIAKSKGQKNQDNTEDTAASEHGEARMDEGFSINELAAEYRALRASVTKLWGNEKKIILPSDVDDLIRFNEAIDQSLNESITSYSKSKEKQTRHLDSMLVSSPDISFIIDTNGVFLYANKAMGDLYQKPVCDIVGQVIYDLEKNLNFEEKNQIQAVFNTGKPCRGDRVFEAPSERVYFFEYIYTPIFDENNRIEAVAGNLRDITERKSAETKIRQMAHSDALTGLPNRRLFSDRLEQAIARTKRDNQHFALLSVDLDKFKQVNDKLGHEAGDLLLKKLSGRLITCVRETDTVARMGGDEFSIIITNLTDEEQTKLVANKILHMLHKPFQIKSQHLKISASIGITLCPQDGIESDTLMGNADKAMYSAKKNGRNQFSFYHNQ